jgi:hypothetical protein
MQQTVSPLKVGLIVDSEIVSKYVYDLVEWGQHRSDVRLALLIVHAGRPPQPDGSIAEARRAPDKRDGLRRYLERWLLALITRWEASRLRRAGVAEEHPQSCDLKPLGLRSLTIEAQVPERGVACRCSKSDINRIRALELDVLVECGAGSPRGDMVKAARFGMLSFDHADTRVDTGAPVGFWEVYLKQATTRFIIQRLTGTLDSGEAVVSGKFLTRSRYLANRVMLYRKRNFFMMRLLNELVETRALPAALEPQPHVDKAFGSPTLSVQFLYILRIAVQKLRDALPERLVRTSQRWGVAFSGGDWRNLVMERAHRIDAPRHHYLADPFVIEEGGRDYCFVEDYDYRGKKGCIAVYSLEHRAAVRLGQALAEPFHLSFPYLFRFDSKLYMCPETYENREIRLYECTEFPLKWTLAKVLMQDVSAVDTMVFERDGLWWLLTNIDRTESGDHCSELFAYFADNPLTSEWTAHSQNPIVVDASRARNGGMLVHDRTLYRVAQRQGFDQYGAGLSIACISTLDKQNYHEEELCSIEPNFFPNLVGTHHMHSNGRFTVFDYASRASSLG